MKPVTLDTSHKSPLYSRDHRREVDVTFVQLPLADATIELVTLLEYEDVLVVRAGSESAPPSLAELAAMPLIGFLTGNECPLTDYFKANNLKPPWIVGSYDLETIYAFVAAGEGGRATTASRDALRGPGRRGRRAGVRSAAPADRARVVDDAWGIWSCPRVRNRGDGRGRTLHAQALVPRGLTSSP